MVFVENEWNTQEWAKSFAVVSQKHDASELRRMRADVFRHTVKVVRAGHYCINGLEYRFSKEETRKMLDGTRFYSQEFTVNEVPIKTGFTQVCVENIDCLAAARMLQLQGYNVAVLNMASRQNPGGGVYGGAGAQEENLFRRSNLFQSMFRFAPYANSYGLEKSSNQYPLDRNFGGLYVPNAMVFKGEEKYGYTLLGDEAFYMSFISVPGINRPELTEEGLIAKYLVEPAKNKIRTIFRIGLQNRHDAIVLGALGCGAFHNPPAHVARLFHEVIEEAEFKNKFSLLYFAILEDHNSGKKHNPSGNYLPFKKEFL